MSKKPRKPLIRKTGLRRTGITRVSNRVCKSAPGNRVVRPRRGLRAKSRTNSNRHVDLAFRREYMDENPKCELCKVADSTDPHHICRSILGTRKWDIRANLLAVCRACHDQWCHGKNLREGLVMCLTKKRLKRELDWAELNRITHINLREHIGGYAGLIAWVETYRIQLVHGGESC